MDYGDLFFVWILYLTLTNATPAAICFRRNSNNVLKEYCCDNYELKHGVCIKCEIGTTSIDGNGCALCPNMTYGERCSNDCKCSSMERCHKKHGCIDTNIKETWIQTTTESK
ncbi:uncharacterized protein LOC143043744 [Mytilus galloprovincialis]|uniref:uncharacterized protein LOC143043744 n=1 Tax=Mytilus galloprovincialis TaxID=29158 RepID=UPI003F7BEEAD